MHAEHEPRTVEELLDLEQARALAGLAHGLRGLGTELGDALRRTPVGRHPLLTGAAAAALGLLAAPLLVRGAGSALRLAGAAGAGAAPGFALGLLRKRLGSLL